MFVRVISLAFLSASLLGVGDAVRSSASIQDELSDGMAKAKAKIEAAVQKTDMRHRNLDEGGDISKGGMSCDCSQAALLQILEAHRHVLSLVPITFMGLLEANGEVLSDSLGLEYDSLGDYKYLRESLQTLVDSATDAMQCLQCGSCDVQDRSDLSSDETELEPELNLKSPFPGISHYECCCDVTYIKEITIKQMHAMTKMVLLNPGAEEFVEAGIDSLETATKDTIEKITRPYSCTNETSTTTTATISSTTTEATTTTTTTAKATTTTTTEIITDAPVSTTTTSRHYGTPCPCFSREDLDKHAKYLYFYGCADNGKAAYINFDTPEKDDSKQRVQRAWSVCAGTDCGDGPGAKKASKTHQCFAGECDFIWNGFKWFDPYMTKDISEEEAEACYLTMQGFCESRKENADVQSIGGSPFALEAFDADDILV